MGWRVAIRQGYFLGGGTRGSGDNFRVAMGSVRLSSKMGENVSRFGVMQYGSEGIVSRLEGRCKTLCLAPNLWGTPLLIKPPADRLKFLS